MRKPITINLNDRRDKDRLILDWLEGRYIAEQTMSRSTILRDLLYDSVSSHYGIVAEEQSDPVDALVAMIADLQDQMVAMGNRLNELSSRPVVTVAPGAIQPIDAIGESIVYDSQPDQVAKPISEDFKRAIIAAAQNRAKGIGKPTEQIEAPEDARRSK